MCEPCYTTPHTKAVILGVVGGVLLLLLICLVVIYLVRKQRREQRAFIVVEEDDELVSLLKTPAPEGPFENPHPVLFWWKEERAGGGVSVEDVSERYRVVCQELLESEGLEVVRVLHPENPFLWQQYALTQTSIKAHLPRPHPNISMNDSFCRLLEPIEVKNHREWMVERLDLYYSRYFFLSLLFIFIHGISLFLRLDLDVEGREVLLFHGSQKKYVNPIFNQVQIFSN